MFASAKRLDNPNGWRWRLAKFGRRLFGNRATNRLQKDQEVLPVAHNHYDRYSPSGSRPLSMASYGQDIKLKKMGDTSHTGTRSMSAREGVDDVERFIDAYDYSTHSRSSQAPSSVHGGEGQYYGQRDQQRRIDRGSLYSEITGNQRHTPEPRQPLRREPSGASRFKESSISTTPKTRQPAKEGVLVDIAEDERPLPSLPLQMASNIGSSTNYLNPGNTSTPTEAQAYMMAVRPGLQGEPSQPTVDAIAPTVTGESFMPIPVHLVPNTTGGQGSYWLTPVPRDAVPMDTTVLRPMNTGASSSRNPFRQEIY